MIKTTSRHGAEFRPPDRRNLPYTESRAYTVLVAGALEGRSADTDWSLVRFVATGKASATGEEQRNQCRAMARQWDDSVVDSMGTLMKPALGLSVVLNAPIRETRFGDFRI